MYNSRSLFAAPTPQDPVVESAPQRRATSSEAPTPTAVATASPGYNVLAITESFEVGRLLGDLGQRADIGTLGFRRTGSLDEAVELWGTGAFDVLLLDMTVGGAWRMLKVIARHAGEGFHPVLLSRDPDAACASLDGSVAECELLAWDDVDVQALFHAVRYAALASHSGRAIEHGSRALGAMQDAVIETLLYTIDLHDPITSAHQRRVADLAARIADELHLDPRAREDLVLSAKVHDIGKISVPSEITSKPASLTTLETEIMRGHVQAGYDVLTQARLPASIADAVYQHHERLDGSGYPRGLVDDELGLPARVLCVADVFEAMTSHRPYRPAFSEHEAMAYLRDRGGVKFDADVVGACAEAVRNLGHWNKRVSASFPMLSLVKRAVVPGDTPGEFKAYAARSSRIARHMGQPLSEMAAAMASQVEIKDAYTAGHQRRVADLSEAIARRLGLDDEARSTLTTAALLHDIGKVSIPNKILHKSTPLSTVEFDLIKTHASCGFDLLEPVSFPGPVAAVVLNHHERLDGSGYPHGLRGSAIPPEARIIAVADTTEAMTFDRPYRPALGWDAAVRELQFGRKTRYDPDVVDACIDVLACWRAEPGEGPWFQA